MRESFDTSALTESAASIGFEPGERFMRREREHAFRSEKMASDNDLTFIDRVENPSYPGNVFEFCRTQPSWGNEVYRLSESPRIEFGEVQYQSHNATMSRSYIAIELPRPLPNIVLDATSNQVLGFSSLPLVPHASQRLRLEGNFDTKFRLFCPAGYERDALYLFTPDVMANLMDGASAFDVELVDNWAILTTPGLWNRKNPNSWQVRLDAVNAIIAKVDQWGRWRDDRAASGEDVPDVRAAVLETEAVAAGGRRLRGSSDAAGCLLAVLGILIVGAAIFIPLLLPSILGGYW